MKFHVPPDRRWSANEIATALQAVGLHSRPECNAVRICLPAIDIPSFPFVWQKIKYEPTITLVFYPEKFLYNGDIQSGNSKLSVNREIEKISAVMEEIEWVLLPDEDLQREAETLLRYTEMEGEIRYLLRELEQLQRAKSEWVASQDFENARRIQQEQDTIRNSLDQLVANRYRGLRPL